MGDYGQCPDCMGTGEEQIPCDPTDIDCEFCEGTGRRRLPPTEALADFGDETWDRFFDFIVEKAPQRIDDVRRELNRAGIDIEPAIKRVRQALARAGARHAQ